MSTGSNDAILGVFLSPPIELDNGLSIPGRVLGDDEPRVYHSCDPRRRRYTLLRDVTFRDSKGHEWVAPAGLTYDGASLWRLFWRWFRPEDPRLLAASAIHDRLCRDDMPRLCDSTTAARVWWEMIRSEGVGFINGWLLWAGVQFFGPQFCGPAGEVDL